MTRGVDADAPVGPGIVTVLFTDVVSSTERWDRLGEDAAEEQRRSHFAVLRDAVRDHDGHEVKNLGDGLMVVFGSAVRAVGCAVAMQRGVARNARHDADGMELRVGLHVGEPIREEADYFGTTVVVAKRLCDRAQGGQILVSSLVASLAHGRCEFVDVGHLTLKGLSEPIQASEVVWREAPVAVDLPPPLRERDEGFVGRNPELDRLASVWAQVADGGQGAVFIGGEPGIGKTRLAAELSRIVLEAGGRVLYGRCDEDLGASYQPFVEALEPVIGSSSRAELLHRIGAGVDQLGRLFPSLTEPAAPGHTEPEEERYLLFEGMTRLLANEAAVTPLLVVLDDLHWAAKSSLLLLRHFIRSPQSSSVMVVGTYRDTEIDARHPLSELLADLRREPAVERIGLRGIDRDGVRVLLDLPHDAPPDPSRDIAEAVHAATQGNPFFVREVLRDLHGGGAAEAQRWLAAFAEGDVGLPEGVREVIVRRVARLSDVAQSVLSVAAAIGASFDVDIVERVDATNRDRVIDGLEEASRAGLLVETEGGYAFTHDLARGTLYGELSRARRVRLHLRIGQAMEQARGKRAPLDALAHHFLCAADVGSADKAVEYACRAADASIEQLAFEHAVATLTRALAVLDSIDLGDDQRAEVLLALAAAHAGASEFDESRRVARLAAERARSSGSPELLARAAILYNEWGNLALGLPDPSAAPLCLEALDRLGPADSTLRARVLAHLALYRFWSEADGDEAHALAVEALDVAERLEDPETLSLAIHAVATSLDGSERVAERLAFVRRQRTLPNRGIFATDSLYGEGIALIELADRSGVEAVIAELESLPSAHGGWWRPRCWAIVFKSMLALMDGRFDEVEPLATEALELWSSPDGVNTYAAQLLMLRREQDRLAELLPMVQDVARAPAFQPVLAWMYAELGEVDGAATTLSAVSENGFSGLARGAMWSASLCWLARATVCVGDVDAGRQLYGLLTPHAGHLVVAGHGGCCLGSADFFLGELAMLIGDGRAEAHLAAGLALEEKMGAAALATRTRLSLARLSQQHGAAETSAAHARATLADAERLCMPALATQASQLLAG